MFIFLFLYALVTIMNEITFNFKDICKDRTMKQTKNPMHTN